MKNLCKFKQLLSLILLARLFAWARVLFFKTTPVSNLYSCEKVHGSGITYMIGLRGIPYVKSFKRMGYILQKLPPYFPIKMLHIQTLLLDTRDKHLSCQSWWIYKIEFVREKNTDKTIWFLIQQKKIENRFSPLVVMSEVVVQAPRKWAWAALVQAPAP